MILVAHLPIEKSPHDQSHWSIGHRKLGKPHGTITVSTEKLTCNKQTLSTFCLHLHIIRNEE